MTRGLYRFYLYAISVALLILAISATSQLLSTLFKFTPLRGSYGYIPDKSVLVQSLVFAVVGWLIAGTLGGLHYWLIRRDIQNDPAASTSGIRSFFLNITEALNILIAVAVIGFGALESWAQYAGSDVSWAVAIGLSTLAGALLLELERRRTPEQRGAALVFQRLHFFGVQMFLLFFLTWSFLYNFRFIVNTLFFNPQGQCTGYYCSSYNPLLLGLTVLWFAACWLVYGLITSKDASRTVRMVMHGASLAFGIGYILGGVFVAFEVVLLRLLFKTNLAWQDIFGYSASHDFLSPLLLGLLITGVYHLLLRDVSRRGLMEVRVRHLSEWAIAAVLLAGTFGWGIGSAIYNLLQGPDLVSGNQAWAAALALMISGVAYIPLEIYFRWQHALDPVNTAGPRRGFVLALLGIGTLGLAIGGATALYAWGTALLGSPIYNWPQLAHSGLSGAIVGGIIASFYLWTARSEHLFTRRPKASEPPAPTTPEVPVTPAIPATIEEVLDELLAGSISREEAATRIRGLGGMPAVVVG